MVIQDKQANGAVTSVGDVFHNDTDMCGSTSSVNERFVRLRMENRYRFKTLYDKTYRMSSLSAGATDGNASSNIKFYIKFAKPLELMYDTSVATEGADAALRSNNINIFCVGNDAVGTRVTCILSGILRLRFADGE
jgi:hypothetical protein